jgi:hypothetical protein
VGNFPPIQVEIDEGEVTVIKRYVSPFGIIIEEGFKCDGQSWFIGEKKAMAGGVIHDHLYRLNGQFPDPNTGKIYTRKEADRIFLEALRLSGVNFASRWTRYLTLRAVGGFAWRGHSKRIENEKANSDKQPEPAASV